MLGRVQAPIGPLDERHRIVRGPEFGHAKRRGNAAQFFVGRALQQFLGLDGLADILGDDQRAIEIG
ncbi:hypothetical protein D3C72_2484320 [compost metagenome]